MISDGDLRRLLERDGGERAGAHGGRDHECAAGDDCAGGLRGEALALMEGRKITSLIVVAPNGEALGVVHLHDLWTTARG